MSHFLYFINQQEYSIEQKKHLESLIISRRLGQIISVCATLAIWSMIAVWIDLVLMPMMLVSFITSPEEINYPLTILIGWTFVNAFLKLTFIKSRLRNAVSWLDALIAVFPYVGAIYLMKHWFVGDPLLKATSLHYIDYCKNSVVNKIKSLI
ncbi:hypothetical protein [Reichenbachiella versicolor]|uniref:hypothetical protein n=1 Tax=Reichenbachiella versicolor TaxID=1821036 RepID=UPI0013A53434|nr:hypothetical protein [Reichenbachiella versicolor]